MQHHSHGSLRVNRTPEITTLATVVFFLTFEVLSSLMFKAPKSIVVAQLSLISYFDEVGFFGGTL